MPELDLSPAWLFVALGTLTFTLAWRRVDGPEGFGMGYFCGWLAVAWFEFL